MPKYIKKPEVVEAVQWFQYGDHPDVSRFIASPKMNTTRCYRCGRLMQDHGRILVSDGDSVMCPGSWIVNRRLGGIQMWSAEAFEQTYERFDDTAQCYPLEMVSTDKLPSPDDSTILCEPNFGDPEQVNDQEEDHHVSEA